MKTIELMIITHMLMQPQLRAKALARQDQFENSVLGELFEALRTDTTDDIAVIDTLISEGLFTSSELALHMDMLESVDKEGLDGLCKLVRVAASDRASPHSHTMADAVTAAYDDIVARAKARGTA